MKVTVVAVQVNLLLLCPEVTSLLPTGNERFFFANAHETPATMPTMVDPIDTDSYQSTIKRLILLPLSISEREVCLG